MRRYESDSLTAPGAMSVADAVYARRSVRAYAPTEVEAGAVRRLLDAAVRAPTAVHEEPWSFVVVQDREILRRLSDKAKELIASLEGRIRLRDGGSHLFKTPDDVFYDAGTLIVICGKALGPFVVADCWLAAENLMLTARAMGLGTCVIGLSVAALNAPEWKKELKIPAETTAYCPIIVGVPSADAPPVARREAEILSWRRGASS